MDEVRLLDVESEHQSEVPQWPFHPASILAIITSMGKIVVFASATISNTPKPRCNHCKRMAFANAPIDYFAGVLSNHIWQEIYTILLFYSIAILTMHHLSSLKGTTVPSIKTGGKLDEQGKAHFGLLS